MGLYDTVLVDCTKSGCDGRAEFQSKAGDCSASYYTIDECPIEIYRDIAGDVEPCQKCGTMIAVPARSTITQELRDRVTEIIDSEVIEGLLQTTVDDLAESILDLFSEYIASEFNGAPENPEQIDRRLTEIEASPFPSISYPTIGRS